MLEDEAVATGPSGGEDGVVGGVSLGLGDEAGGLFGRADGAGRT